MIVVHNSSLAQFVCIHTFYIHSTNFKISNNLNTILTYFIYLKSIFYTEITNVLPEDDPQKVETFQSSSTLSMKTVYCNIVHLLVFS